MRLTANALPSSLFCKLSREWRIRAVTCLWIKGASTTVTRVEDVRAMLLRRPPRRSKDYVDASTVLNPNSERLPRELFARSPLMIDSKASSVTGRALRSSKRVAALVLMDEARKEQNEIGVQNEAILLMSSIVRESIVKNRRITRSPGETLVVPMV
mmetsp:Transcript_39222/g.79216  ORF Transcript_39222/g.79216 Transcript_39222/m.79216 type:complete len:156 (-) Transcript_39222:68-535(-)